MRIIALILPSLFMLADCAGPKSLHRNLHELDGTWIPVKQEIGGKELPASVYQTQKMILEDTAYTVIAESTDKGIVKYNGNKIDIYGKDGVNAGKHFTAIYKYENELLTICYNLMGDSYPGDFTTSGKPLFFLSVFKREAAQ